MTSEVSSSVYHVSAKCLELDCEFSIVHLLPWSLSGMERPINSLIYLLVVYNNKLDTTEIQFKYNRNAQKIQVHREKNNQDYRQQPSTEGDNEGCSDVKQYLGTSLYRSNWISHPHVQFESCMICVHGLYMDC